MFFYVEVAFGDEIEAVQKEAKALREGGVEIIIALGHSGYEVDQVNSKKRCSTMQHCNRSGNNHNI